MLARGIGVNKAKIAVLALMLLAGAPGANAQNAESSMQVRVRYIVNDVPASVTFYTDKLGFRIDAQSGPYFAALSRGGIQLLLSPTTGPGGASQAMPNGDKPKPGGGWARMVLDTKDLQTDFDRLRKEGVRFRNEIIVGLGGNQILLDDPSGNVIELFQPTAVYQQQQSQTR
jgi:catechol 2,3-dioxygenase-like lactoylglutathione lyase family enzyme